MKNKTHIKFYIISFLQFLMEEIVGTSLIIFLLYKDLSLREVNFLLAFGFFIVWIGEIPTGLVADKYGRKASIIIGLILHLIYLYTFIEKQGYYILLFASIFSGLYTCFISGSLEAWVVENTDRPIEEIFSNNNIIRNVAGVTAGIFGAILASKNLVYPWIFSFIISIVLLIFMIFFVSDNFRYTSEDKKQTIKSISMNSLSIVKNNKEIFIIFIVALFIALSNSAANVFQQPRFLGTSNYPIWIMGILKVVFSIAMIFGSYIAKIISKNREDYYGVSITCFILFLFLILSSISNRFYFILPMFILYEIGRGMYPVTSQIFINKRIPNEYRATLLSLLSSFFQFGMCMGLIITGIISKSYINLESNQMPIQISWAICSIFALIAFCIINLARIKKDSH